MPLSQKQIDAFNGDGVLIAKNLLGEDDLQPMIDELWRVGRRARPRALL